MPSLSQLLSMKGTQEPIACLTVYDASFARLLVQQGVDVLLVGDSLGMVVQGQTSTVPVTLDEMIYHAKLVRRGAPEAFIMVDLPFMSGRTLEAGLDAAQRVMQQAGADMVKIEGGDEATLKLIAQLTAQGVPVCGHLGLLPQQALRLGYRATGKTADSAAQLRQQAQALVAAGASFLVFECVDAALATSISQQLSILTIGIGSGAGTDGQVLVLHDILGLSPRSPSFAPCFMTEGRNLPQTIAHYVASVKAREFP